MNYAMLAEIGSKLEDSNANMSTRTRVSSPVSESASRKRGTSVLDNFINTPKSSSNLRGHDGKVRSRVADSAKPQAKQRITDTYTAEQLIDMSRSERRRYLGSLSPRERSHMIGEMNKIKDSRKVTDAIENMDGTENQSQLINLAVLINNIKKEDSEFTRKLLAECLETLPEKYADYTYYEIDGAETSLSDEEIAEIEGQLDDICATFNIPDSRKRRVQDSVLDDVVESSTKTQDIDELLAGIGEYLKTGKMDKLAEVRQNLTGGAAETSETDETTEEEETIQENTDNLFGDETEPEDGSGDLFGDETETDTTESENETEDGEDDLFGDETDSEPTDEKEDVGFEDEGDVIEVPEGVDENVKNLVQELLDMFGSKSSEEIGDAKMKKICIQTKKFVTDSIESSDNELLTADTSGYSLSEYPTLEASEELVRIPLGYTDYVSLSDPETRELDIKSLMPSYSCCPSTIEPCTSRCVKVTSEDGVVSYWTPICGAVDTDAVPTMTCEDLQTSYVPVDAFCNYAAKLNQLDLISPVFYKEVVESPMWCVAEDCDTFGLKAGERIIPDCEGGVKIFDRCYRKVE